MNWAISMQAFQDWFSKQWIIIWGRKITSSDYRWLFGPFGEVDGIGEKFIHQMAEREDLIIIRNTNSKGLLNSFSD